MKRRGVPSASEHPAFDHRRGSKPARNARGSVRAASRHTTSGRYAACMQSQSHVVADLGKPGTKSVGSTGCVSFLPRRSSWKHSPDGEPFGPLCDTSAGRSRSPLHRSGSGCVPANELSPVVLGQCSRSAYDGTHSSSSGSRFCAPRPPPPRPERAPRRPPRALPPRPTCIRLRRTTFIRSFMASTGDVMIGWCTSTPKSCSLRLTALVSASGTSLLSVFSKFAPRPPGVRIASSAT